MCPKGHGIKIQSRSDTNNDKKAKTTRAVASGEESRGEGFSFSEVKCAVRQAKTRGKAKRLSSGRFFDYFLGEADCQVKCNTFLKATS